MAVEREQPDQPIPEERVFATFKLYLAEDGTIAADIDYDGTKLPALGVDHLQGMICRHAAEHVMKDLKETVEHVGQMTEMAELLKDIFAPGETDDSEDSNSTEGSSERAAGAGE